MKLKELIDIIKDKFSKHDTIVNGFDFSKYSEGDIVSFREFPDLHNGNKYYDPLGNVWHYSCGTWRNFGNPANRSRKPTPEPKEDDSFWYKETITDEDIWGKNMH